MNDGFPFKNTSIDVLDLSPKAKNELSRRGIQTIYFLTMNFALLNEIGLVNSFIEQEIKSKLAGWVREKVGISPSSQDRRRPPVVKKTIPSPPSKGRLDVFSTLLADEQPKQSLSAVSIVVLELSVRANNILQREKITTLTDASPNLPTLNASPLAGKENISLKDFFPF